MLLSTYTAVNFVPEQLVFLDRSMNPYCRTYAAYETKLANTLCHRSHYYLDSLHLASKHIADETKQTGQVNLSSWCSNTPSQNIILAAMYKIGSPPPAVIESSELDK